MKLKTIAILCFLFSCIGAYSQTRGFKFSENADSIIAVEFDSIMYEEVSIRYADSLLAVFGFQWVRRDECIMSFYNIPFTPYDDYWEEIDYIIGIPEEYEQQWIEYFISTGLITEVKYFFKGFSCPPILGVSPELIEVKNDYAITTIQEFNSQISELKEIAKAYYKSYYASKGEFTELKETSQGYSFRIDKLTREVVKYHDYWEQLIVTLNFEAKEGYSDVVIVKHYIEGFYQAKRGENPTYSNSLEKDKFSELVNYGLILRNEFSEYLKK